MPNEEAILDKMHGALLPFVETMGDQRRFPAGCDEALLSVNERLDSMEEGYNARPKSDVESYSRGETYYLSGYLVMRAKHFSLEDREDLAVQTLDLGVRWPQSQVARGSYREAAVSAALSGDPAKTDLAYGVVLSEERMTTANGLTKTIDKMAEIGCKPEQIMNTLLCLLADGSMVHAAAITSRQKGNLGGLYRDRVAAYIEMAADLASANFDEESKQGFKDRAAESFAHFVIAGEKQWVDDLAYLFPDLHETAMPLIPRSVHKIIKFTAAKATNETVNVRRKSRVASTRADENEKRGRVASRVAEVMRQL
jgi:hypothetical protein